MPKIDGIEVARRLRRDPNLPFIPIIMQTALDSTESKVEGLEAGADDYITKPIDFPELKARIYSMLRIKKSMDGISAFGQGADRVFRPAFAPADLIFALIDTSDVAKHPLRFRAPRIKNETLSTIAASKQARSSRVRACTECGAGLSQDADSQGRR